MLSVRSVDAVAEQGASRQRCALAAAGAGGFVLCGLAFAVVFTSEQPGDRLLVAFGRALAVPIAVGLRLWSQAQYERFGRLLVVAGYCVWFLATLAEAAAAG